MTIIYPSPIFGPVHSRRLGISLGINLMPGDGKVCTFDCIYCECGLNSDFPPRQKRPTREEVRLRLEEKLQQMSQDGELPDVLTFAGNGEPTAHPQFDKIIEDTIALRNRYCPSARVSVLSNATMIHKKNVRDALMLVDNNIQKLDTVSAEYIRLLDRPVHTHYDVNRVVEQLKMFHGHVIVQTMFLQGTFCGQDLDNTTDHYVLPWLETIKSIAPEQVMIYTIDRDTPVEGLRKASPRQLDRIRNLVEEAGLACSVSY